VSKGVKLWHLCYHLADVCSFHNAQPSVLAYVKTADCHHAQMKHMRF